MLKKIITRHLWCVLVLFSGALHAQQWLFSKLTAPEFFIGTNRTLGLGSPRTSNLPVAQPVSPGLGWQAGALVSYPIRGPRVMFKTGISVIYRHYQETFFGFSPKDTSIQRYLPAIGYGISGYQYYDLEMPLLIGFSFRLSDKVSLQPTLGVIPGWRISETHKRREDSFTIDADGVLDVQSWQISFQPQYNHRGPFNRINIYAGLQFRLAGQTGRTLTIEPNVRVNIMPFIETIRLYRQGGGLTLVGPENATATFGLNFGFLPKKRR